ncbi:MAG: endolytic transglycosylase MltG [Bacteroidales bacterium]|nr:endolytic transglycosylase MltG [Bacteroidales bacterium]
MSKWFKYLLIIVGVVIITTAATIWHIYNILYSPIPSANDETIIYVNEDDSLDSIAVKLEQSVGFAHFEIFKQFATLKRYTPSRRIGRYNIANLSIDQIVNKLRIGDQDPINFTFISTRSINDIIEQASRSFYQIDSLMLDSLLNNEQMIKSLGFNKSTLSALFIPNTYEMFWTTNEITLLNRMKQEYNNFWNSDRKSKADKIGLTPIEIATLASIIDEESSVVSEYRRIAGVYLNRLKRGMKLEADPTLKFANNDFDAKRVLDKHKLIDSPYNTYMYAGLPPGPIRVPSLQAIEAVLNAENHNFIFFCANADFSGTHVFAKTLREHNVNANKYRKALQQRKIYR